MDRIEIARIEMPTPDVFYREYMCRLRPVVISNLFEGERIREIDSREKVIATWGGERIVVQDEYVKAYREAARAKRSGAPAEEIGTSAELPTMSIAEYYAFVDQNRNTRKMCIEFPSPQAFQDTFRVPEVCRATAGESPTFVNQCFIGNAGNYALPHFDKAGLHGFLYQVFGKKRFVVFPHSASRKLAPFTQIGTWYLQNFSDRDREAFLAFTGGAEVILDTGDCMYVPSLSWHYVSYLEDSMSISLRFRRPNHVTELINALFPDIYLQGIASRIADPASAGGEHRAILDEIRAAASAPYTDGVEHVRKMRALAKEIHARLYPSMGSGPYTLDPEEFLPNPLAHFLDADHPKRPRYA